MAKTWIKIHVEFLDNPKVMSLNLALRGVWFTALGVAERYDREGLLPPADRFALMAHTDDETAEKAYAALTKKGLLDETADGFRIHDWQEWQARKPSDEPEAVAARQAKHRASRRVTPSNALRDVTETSHASNAYARAPSESKSEKEINPQDANASLPPRGRRRTTATQIPDDFEVTPELREVAIAAGVPPEQIAVQTEQWRDHHAEKGDPVRDAAASWRKWMRNVPAYAPRNSSNGNGHAPLRATRIDRADSTQFGGSAATPEGRADTERRIREAEGRAALRAEQVAPHGN